MTMQESNSATADEGAARKAENADPPAASDSKRTAEEPPSEDEPPKKKPALPSSTTAARGKGDPPLMPTDFSGPSIVEDLVKRADPPDAGAKADGGSAAAPAPKKDGAPSTKPKSDPPASTAADETTAEKAEAVKKTAESKPASTTERATRSSERTTRFATKTNTDTATEAESAVESKQSSRRSSSAAAQAKSGGTSTSTTSKAKEATTPTGTGGGKSTSGGTARTATSGNKKATTSEQPPKALKGLRHFSMMVCKKVEEKGQTTYNEVADELVKQVIESRKKEDPQGKFDEKNIRRRVYDSINVLLAMDIIAKDKKEISWKGLPTMAHHDIEVLEREEEARKEQVQAKRRALQELMVQQICFRNLVRHNKQREIETLHAEKVPLPFIVVNTNREAIIHCNMAPDLHNVMFEFDRPFEINDDNSILTRLGMHRTTIPDLKELVPEDLVTYCQEHGLLDDVLRGSSADDDADNPMALTSVGSNRGQYFQSLD